MFRLLHTEYLKFKHASVIPMMALLYIIASPLILIFGRDLFSSIPKNFVDAQEFTEFPAIWDYQGYVMSYFVSFLLGYMVLYTISSEVRNKTMRQNILTGYTRKAYFLAKLSIVGSLSIFATIYYVLSTIVIGIIFTEGWDMELIMDSNWAPIRFFIMCFGTLAFAMLIGFFFKKGTVAVFFYFSYILIIESFLRFVVHLNLVNNSSVNYWPLNTLEDNMPNPLLRLPDNFLKSSDFNFNVLLDASHAGIFGTLYGILFVAGAWFVFRKRDL